VLVDAMRLLFFPALMAFAAASDLLTMTISNRISLALVAGFFLLALTTGMPPATVGLHTCAGLIVLVLSFICFARGWIGGGDAKLAAATALWMGLDHTMTFLVFASLIGGVLTFAVIQFRLMPLPSLLSNQEWVARLHRADAGVPYGIALAIAALLAYPDSPFMKAAAGL